MSIPEDQKLVAVKAAAAWGGTGASLWLESIGFTSWAEVAAFLAALYTLLMIVDWVIKRFRRRRATKLEQRYVENSTR